MRNVAKAFALAVLVLLAPSVVFADYISDAVQALQETPVYVAPGTEGTDQNTAARLEARLTKDDKIVLVMLPAEAEQRLGADITTIAARLSEELGDQKIIGLAVGNEVVGHAPRLPTGVAADQMRRANSVSNDPVTALGTFAQNIHGWQRDNPEPEPTPFEAIRKGSSSWLIWIAVIASIIVIIGIVSALAAATASKSNTERRSFQAPNQVRDLLARIVRDRTLVNDQEFKRTLYQMCLDIEKYFATSSSDKGKDASFFRQRLTEVVDVLTKYVEVQNAPRYYEEPETELERGKESIKDFSHYVLMSIRRGNAVSLLDYKVNTNILQAQRHRQVR